MEFILEIILQFLGEIFLQVVFEVLAELGLRSVVAPFKKPPSPWLATLGYILFGAVLGALSLWILPGLLIESLNLQYINLIFTPIMAGTAMAILGAWRRRRDQRLIRLDRFLYSYVFALAMALTRFSFAH